MRRLEATEPFAWVLPVHQKAWGTGDSPACWGGRSQAACSATLGSAPAHRQETSLLSPCLRHFLLALTACLVASRSRNSAFLLHVRWDPAPPISSSPVSPAAPAVRHLRTRGQDCLKAVCLLLQLGICSITLLSPLGSSIFLRSMLVSTSLSVGVCI